MCYFINSLNCLLFILIMQVCIICGCLPQVGLCSYETLLKRLLVEAKNCSDEHVFKRSKSEGKCKPFCCLPFIVFWLWRLLFFKFKTEEWGTNQNCVFNGLSFKRKYMLMTWKKLSSIHWLYLHLQSQFLCNLPKVTIVWTSLNLEKLCLHFIWFICLFDDNLSSRRVKHHVFKRGSNCWTWIQIYI